MGQAACLLSDATSVLHCGLSFLITNLALGFNYRPTLCSAVQPTQGLCMWGKCSCLWSRLWSQNLTVFSQLNKGSGCCVLTSPCSDRLVLAAEATGRPQHELPGPGLPSCSLCSPKGSSCPPGDLFQQGTPYFSTGPTHFRDTLVPSTPLRRDADNSLPRPLRGPTLTSVPPGYINSW